ncbi:MAG: outer membrane protein assembly factor BamD [Pyrinomonadaceae bacterium MAG19_C2-C3]|nr:outer membrane protein assembly factor BamD [Pyrinomonadaceae bacterium MAG19_C2-C3]
MSLLIVSASLVAMPVVNTTAARAARPLVQQQGEGTPAQRLEVVRARLDTLRRTLNSAIAVYNANDKGKDKKKDDEKSQTMTATEDGAARLRGLEREVASFLSETANLRGKQDRAERFDVSDIAKLEAAVTDVNTRIDSGLQSTAEERRRLGGSREIAASGSGNKKKKEGFFGKLNPFGGGGTSKYEELTTTVAPGRDRELFEEAVRQTRKSSYDTARLLFQTIVTTYTESPFLPLAKLAIADTFYREGTTSALIQAGASYRDWLTFFPTHVLADDVMLKMAEAEMRQMGLPSRSTEHARKAEQQLKVVLQQFPATTLRPEVNKRLTEVQENLAMHDLDVATFYYQKFTLGTANNPKGAQSRLREIVEKYPNFSYTDQVLHDLARTYLDEEEPDEAAKYYARLMREFPNSRYAEKAGEELDKIGVARPSPDPEALERPAPVRPGMMGVIVSEILGTVPVTVRKDGVLISANNDGNDLIEEAVRNNGEVRDSSTPDAVIYRRAPARPVAPLQTTAPPRPAIPGNAVSGSTTNGTATPAVEGSPSISIQPTRPGVPLGNSNIPGQQQPAPLTPNPQLPTTPTTDDDAPTTSPSSTATPPNVF